MRNLEIEIFWKAVSMRVLESLWALILKSLLTFNPGRPTNILLIINRKKAPSRRLFYFRDILGTLLSQISFSPRDADLTCSEISDHLCTMSQLNLLRIRVGNVLGYLLRLAIKKFAQLIKDIRRGVVARCRHQSRKSWSSNTCFFSYFDQSNFSLLYKLFVSDEFLKSITNHKRY